MTVQSGFIWLLRELYFVFIEPTLTRLNLVPFGLGDPTYGRDQVAYSEAERTALYENPKVRFILRRLYMCGMTPVLEPKLEKTFSKLPVKYGDRIINAWINYYIFDMPDVPKRKYRYYQLLMPGNADVYLVHGINEYTGRMLPQITKFLQNGFRVVAMDLPGFGRSTGLHAYVPSMHVLEGAVESVMQHVTVCDEVNGTMQVASRKRFALGGSMYVSNVSHTNISTGAALPWPTMQPYIRRSLHRPPLKLLYRLMQLR